MAESGQIKELHDKIAMLTGAITKQNTAISELSDRHNAAMAEQKMVIADLRKRLAYYENPHSPPSRNPLPTRSKKADNCTH